VARVSSVKTKRKASSKPAMPIGFKGAKKPRKAAAKKKSKIYMRGLNSLGKLKPKAEEEDFYTPAAVKKRQAAARKEAARNMKAAKAKAHGRQPDTKQPDPAAVAMLDKLSDALARVPKGPLSLSMQSLLLDPSQFLIVKSPKGGITNREEFTNQLESLGLKVVFLEYSQNSPTVPTVERHQREWN